MNMSLFKNYLVVALRHLKRNKTFAVVNIVGLSLGMTAAIVIGDYLRFETSFDDFHEQSENIYRVTTEWNSHITPEDKRATTMAWAGPGAKEAFQEVVDYTRFAPLHAISGEASIVFNDTPIQENNIYLADPGFIKVFSFHLLAGNPGSLLNDPNNMIITRSVAERYFKGMDALNKTVTLNAQNLTTNEFRITGIVDDPPPNSHIQFDFIISYNAIPKGLDSGSTYWHWDFTYCYLLLHPNVDVQVLAQKMSDLRVHDFGKEFGVWNDQVNFKLQRITAIHLKSSLKSELSVNSDNNAITFLTIIAFGILLSAYINYINLSTVSALQRRKEMGVRKVIGSSSRQLLTHVIAESLSINILSFILAIVLAYFFERCLSSVISIPWMLLNFELPSTQTVLLFSGVLLTGVLLSVIYPAYVLSSFRPAEVLKGNMNNKKGGGRSPLRNILTISQFAFCLLFIIGAFTLYRQLQFMRNYDLGMNTERVIVVNGYGFQSYNEYLNFKRIAESSPAVASVGYETAAPGDDIMMLGLRPKLAVKGNDVSAELKLVSVDEGLFNTLDINLLAGRQFESSIVSDSNAVMLNAEAAKILGYADPTSIIGQIIGGSKDKDLISGIIGEAKVVGVVADFHQRSLKNPLDPMIFVPSWNLDLGWNKRYYFIKVNGDTKEQSSAVALIRDAWIRSSPSHPFNYYFLETSIAQHYRYENDVAGLFVLFSGLSIFISALGLFGLIAFITINRTKEIGIRKVLGASVSSILTLLSGNIVRMLVVATIIALPLSWYAISRWIERYAFRIEISPVLFIWPILCVFMVAITTVVLRSLRTARDKPVNSLRQE